MGKKSLNAYIRLRLKSASTQQCCAVTTMDSGVCGCEKASCLRSDPDPSSSQSQMV